MKQPQRKYMVVPGTYTDPGTGRRVTLSADQAEAELDRLYSRYRSLRPYLVLKAKDTTLPVEPEINPDTSDPQA